MAKDIRISIDWPGHKKCRRLIQRLGHEGHTSLVFLWVKAAQYHPKGVLVDWDAEDIAFYAQWPGDPGEFVGALLDIGLLDMNGDTYEIHDWYDHNRFVFFGPERSKQSSKAAKIKWEKLRGVKTEENQTPNPDSNADSNAVRNAPLPTPTPTPIGGGRKRPAQPAPLLGDGSGVPQDESIKHCLRCQHHEIRYEGYARWCLHYDKEIKQPHQEAINCVRFERRQEE